MDREEEIFAWCKANGLAIVREVRHADPEYLNPFRCCRPDFSENAFGPTPEGAILQWCTDHGLQPPKFAKTPAVLDFEF